TFANIAAKIETFQYTCMHRDYHSRNLMILESNQLGVLDFQDAVWGPVTYDALSLLKDCYISWPRDKVLDLLGQYHQMLLSSAIISKQTFAEFITEFDWVGVQRHLKVIGIFSRLHLRDRKPGFLKDIPLAMRYLIEALSTFDELNEFNTWVSETILPIYQDVMLVSNMHKVSKNLKMELDKK
ncbi:MAG: aminoglycoside phosphotransferase family protein, partial [Gammaproteobacteria bacterium]